MPAGMHDPLGCDISVPTVVGRFTSQLVWIFPAVGMNIPCGRFKIRVKTATPLARPLLWLAGRGGLFRVPALDCVLERTLRF